MSRPFFLLALVALGLNFTPPAFACSPLFGKTLRNNSDAIVWGEIVAQENGTATITVTRREKGPRTRKLHIRWDPNFVDDGVNCPEWRPIGKRERGRFFLASNGDRAFWIRSHDHRPGTDN